MYEVELTEALKKISDIDDYHYECIMQDCYGDDDVPAYLMKYLKENPTATVSDVYEEIANIHGIPYWDDEIKEQVYKYPQFAYKIEKKINRP